MSDEEYEQQKSEYLASVSGIKWDGENVYLPENFSVAWEIVRWSAKVKFFDDPKHEWEQKTEVSRLLVQGQNGSLGDMVKKLMDKIFSLAIEAGMIYGNVVEVQHE